MKTIRVVMDIHLDELSAEERETIAKGMEDGTTADSLDTLDGVTVNEIAQLLEKTIPSPGGNALILENSGSDAMCKIVGCVVQSSEWQ